MNLRKNINLFYLNSVFTGLIFVVPIWVTFERQYLNFAQMAWLEVIGTSMLVALQLPTGALADLIGRKNTMILGWFLSGLGNICFGLSTSWAQLVISYILVNFGVATVSGADVALVYDSLKELKRENEFQKVVSRKSLYFQISMVMATLCGGYLYMLGVSLPYLLLGFAQFAGGIVVFFMIEPHIDSEKFTLFSYVKKTKDGFCEIFKNAGLAELSLFYVLVGGLTWSAQIFYNQLFATSIGFSDIEKSWFFAFLRLFNSVLLFKLIKIQGFVTKKRLFLVYPIFMIIAFLPGIFAVKILGGLLILLASFMGSARFSTLDYYMNQEFDSRHRATALSALSMLVSLIYIALTFIGGPIMQNFSVKAVYSFLGVLTVIFVLPLGIRLYRKK